MQTQTTEDADIRDEDLLAQLEAERAKGGAFFDLIRGMLADQQRRRDEERAAGLAKAAVTAALPREARRRAAIREVIENAAPAPQDIRHIHSVLAVCGLPYERPDTSVRVHERGQGKVSIRVEAGSLLRPDGTWEDQPIPYGPKARLMLMHFCSEAIRTKSREVDVGETLSSFMKGLGFQVTGGRKGSLNLFKEQINALAACSIRIGTFDGTSARTTKFDPFNKVEVWMGREPGQRSLWSSTLTFSPEFYESLSRHALPVNAEAVRAFAGSARKLDLYLWLGYRLHSLRHPLRLSWKALGEQFGGGFKRERAFRSQFAEELAHIREVFPRLPATLTPDGLSLEPAGPDVLALPSAPRRQEQSRRRRA